jgi:hypothetical protein
MLYGAYGTIPPPLFSRVVRIVVRTSKTNFSFAKSVLLDRHPFRPPLYYPLSDDMIDQSEPTTPAETPGALKPPRCAMCRARMVLLRSEPDAGGGDRCTFACPKCEFVKTKVVGGPPDLSRHRPPKKARRPQTR